MAGHEQFGEDLALYALNALEGEDRHKLEEHLASCTECRLELEQLRGDGALLALSTVGPRPPQRARKRLMDAIAAEVPTSRAKTAREMGRPRHSWWGWLGWAATAAVIVFALSLWKENVALKADFAALGSRASETARELEELRRVAAPILSNESQRVTLVALKTAPQPQGKAFYLRNRSSLVFVANNMPALPPQKAYELWLIPVQGAPIPAGVFKPDAHGSATVVNPPLPAGAEAKAFAITVENESGATTPTMPIVMMGAGE
ncbi:MAG TPA: anti-sigma factor [Candidatus Sulfotelmatobacter sp.]|jgi:anti-sigma-K factor RskA|nr:anti-sigma factor [Candidatus Sulfotelmatobacter sp.]